MTGTGDWTDSVGGTTNVAAAVCAVRASSPLLLERFNRRRSTDRPSVVRRTVDDPLGTPSGWKEVRSRNPPKCSANRPFSGRPTAVDRPSPLSLPEVHHSPASLSFAGEGSAICNRLTTEGSLLQLDLALFAASSATFTVFEVLHYKQRLITSG